jgi:predicted DNA-binding antitoxin AbrB/MazE fold protein
MGAAFDKLKGMLEEKGALTQEQIDETVKADGAMSPQEIMELESLRLKKGERMKVSMEAYLEASKVLDTAAEGSEEYKKAEAIVNAFESGS